MKRLWFSSSNTWVLSITDDIDMSLRQIEDMVQLMHQVQIGVGELKAILAQCNGSVSLSTSHSQTLAKIGIPSQHSGLDPTCKDHETEATAATAISNLSWQQALQLVESSRESKCSLWCTCACHSGSSRRHLSSPATFDRLTGQLLIGVSGHHSLRQRCNLRSCKGNSAPPSVRIRYKFPAWWPLAYSMTLEAQTRDLGIVLRFPQVRPYELDVFEMVAHGRLDALKAAFSARTASIYDTEDTGGHTLLHRALITRNVDVIDFLVKQGADTLAVNQKKNSAADLFWRSVLSGVPETTYGRLVSHFTDGTAFIEEGGFTVVHRILFGQSKADLDQTLQDMPHLIDEQDAYGQSPLHWAATRGDVPSVTTLLRHNATLDIVERGG